MKAKETRKTTIELSRIVKYSSHVNEPLLITVGSSVDGKLSTTKKYAPLQASQKKSTVERNTS